MSSSKTLRIFSSAHEAEILRTRLDAAGILSIVDGAEVASMFSNIGMSLAKVRLKVAPEDFERAKGILAEDERLSGELTAWSCVRCDEDNDASFELCWNCGKQRDDLDTQRYDREVNDTVQPTTTANDQNAQRFPPSDNPYAPTWVEPDGSPTSNDQQRLDETKSRRTLVTVFLLAVIFAIGWLIMTLRMIR